VLHKILQFLASLIYNEVQGRIRYIHAVIIFPKYREILLIFLESVLIPVT